MKNLYIILFIFIVNPLFAQYGWHLQNSNTHNLIGGISFVNENTGYMVGFSGTLRKTTNGGDNWITQNPGTGFNLHKVFFRNADEGNVVAENGLLLYTSTGGTSWITQATGTSSNLSRVNFIKFTGQVSDTGYLVASDGKIMKSIDGGKTWISKQSITNYNLYCVFFPEANIGYAVGENGTIIKTVNGGDNWTNVSPPSSNKTLMGVCFKDANTGIVTGGSGYYNSGIIYRTTDGGQTWSSFGSGVFSGSFHTAAYVTHNTFVAVGNYGVILRSEDNGISWTIQNTPTNELLYDVCFPSENVGYAAGTNGVIIKTTTGGLTGLNPLTGIVPDTYSLYQNYPNPFNPSTTIKFDLSNESAVRLNIFDGLGRLTKTLYEGKLKAGSYQYSFDGSNYTSGIYYYSITAGNFKSVKKMVLIK